MARIKVRHLQTGQNGTIDEKDFDPTIFEKQKGILQKIVESPLIPATGAVLGGAGGAIAGLGVGSVPGAALGGGIGAGAGTGLQKLLRPYVGSSYEQPQEQLGQATQNTALGAATGTGIGLGAKVLGGAGYLYKLATLDPRLKKLGEQRSVLEKQQEPTPLRSIQLDVLENAPKQFAGTSYGQKEINNALHNYLGNIGAVSREIIPNKPVVDYPTIQKIIEKGNKLYGETGLNAQTQQIGSATLRDFYTRQIPGIAKINDQMAELLKLQPEAKAVKSRATQAAIGASVTAIIWGLLNALKGKASE